MKICDLEVKFLLPLLVLTFLAIVHCTFADIVHINWIKYSKPSRTGDDYAFSVCGLGNYIVIVGATNCPNCHAYAELRYRANGDLVKQWVNYEPSFLYDCASTKKYVIAVGNEWFNGWVIYVLNKNLDLVRKIVENIRFGQVYSICTWKSRVILAGTEDGYVDDHPVEAWRIEERYINNMSISKSRIYFENTWGTKSGPMSVKVDRSSGYIWIVGYYKDFGGWIHSFILILNDNLSIVKSLDFSENPYVASHRYYAGILYDLCFDNKGYVYVIGSNGLLKLSRNGDVIAINKNISGTKITCIHNLVIVFSNPSYNNICRQTLFILNSNMRIIYKLILNPTNSKSYFDIGHVFVQNNTIYVAGYDYASYTWGSRIDIYSISINNILQCDFNHNGRLDVGDVVLLLRILVGTYRSNVPCDLNHNGKLDIGDAILLLKKLVGLS